MVDNARKKELVREYAERKQVAGVFALSWTPDAQHLVFVLGLPHDENPPPPAQIYVYTPSNSQQ